MNERQRQLVLLTWLMMMLSVVLVFLLVYAPESPLNYSDDINNITNEDPVQDKNITRGFELPGVFGDAYNGLKEMYEDMQTGFNAVGGGSGS